MVVSSGSATGVPPVNGHGQDGRATVNETTTRLGSDAGAEANGKGPSLGAHAMGIIDVIRDKQSWSRNTTGRRAAQSRLGALKPGEKILRGANRDRNINGQLPASDQASTRFSFVEAMAPANQARRFPVSQRRES